jgi:hypothetical protein
MEHLQHYKGAKYTL